VRTDGFNGTLQRERHLNALSYVVIVALIAISGVLLFMLLTSTPVPDAWLFTDHVFRTVFTGLLLAIILYMIDQRRRLRGELLAAHRRLEDANREITSALGRLSYAQHVAEVMTSLTQTDALERVLRESAQHFGAEAAAVVGEEVTLFADESLEYSAAHTVALQVALDAVRAGKPIEISNTQTGSEALAVPLRIRGELASVLCLWKSGEPFDPDHLEGLGLVARIIELAKENQLLLAEARTQLAGTLRTLATLIDSRVPEYRRRSALIAEHVVSVGGRLGLEERTLSDLRIAAMLADVGMLEVSDSIILAERPLTPEETAQIRLHPAKGAYVARNAAFSPTVQEAIRDHHERLDGSGYPRRLVGDQIAIGARILAVADSFSSMTSPRPYRPAMSIDHAVSELIRGADVVYDRRVVQAFIEVIGYRSPDRVTAQSADPIAEQGRGRTRKERVGIN